MKKQLQKVLKFKRTMSFIFADKMITETWIWFGKFEFSTNKPIRP